MHNPVNQPLNQEHMAKVASGKMDHDGLFDKPCGLSEYNFLDLFASVKSSGANDEYIHANIMDVFSKDIFLWCRASLAQLFRITVY